MLTDTSSEIIGGSIMGESGGEAQGGMSRGGFAALPYESAFARIVGKIQVQVFLFAVAISILLLALAMIARDSPENKTSLIIAGGIIGLALVAMVIYLVAHARRLDGVGNSAPAAVNDGPTRATQSPLEDRQTPAAAGGIQSYDEFRYAKSISTTRAAMLLGAVLYAAYYFLDVKTVDNSGDLSDFLLIRAIVCGIILLSWLLTFTAWFKQFEARAITSLCLLAGLGLLAMIVLGGPGYYYEGLTLVIMFGAFVFGLPSRHLILLCSTLIAAYWLVTLHPNSVDPRHVLANNFFLLTSATSIAIGANRVLNRMSREVFIEASLAAAAKERQADLFKLAAERLNQLHEELRYAEGNSDAPANQILARLMKDIGSIRNEMHTYIHSS